MPKNWMLQTIFGLNRENVTKSWKKVHNGMLNKFWYSLTTIRVIACRRKQMEDQTTLWSKILDKETTFGESQQKWNNYLTRNL
jgi:hypothetical protein